MVSEAKKYWGCKRVSCKWFSFQSLQILHRLQRNWFIVVQWSAETAGHCFVLFYYFPSPSCSPSSHIPIKAQLGRAASEVQMPLSRGLHQSSASLFKPRQERLEGLTFQKIIFPEQNRIKQLWTLFSPHTHTPPITHTVKYLRAKEAAKNTWFCFFFLRFSVNLQSKSRIQCK